MAQKNLSDLIINAKTRKDFLQVIEEAKRSTETSLFNDYPVADELAENDDLRIYVFDHCFNGKVIGDPHAERLLDWLEYNGVDEEVTRQAYTNVLKNITSDVPAIQDSFDINYVNLSSWLDRYDVSQVLRDNPKIIDRLLEHEVMYPINRSIEHEQHRTRMINGLIANGVTKEQIADGFTRAALAQLDKTKARAPGVEDRSAGEKLMSQENLFSLRQYGADTRMILEAAIPAVEKGQIREISGMVVESQQINIPKNTNSMLYQFNKSPNAFFNTGTEAYNKRAHMERTLDLMYTEPEDIEDYLIQYDQLNKEDQIDLLDFAYKITQAHLMNDTLADLFEQKSIPAKSFGYNFEKSFDERQADFKSQICSSKPYIRFQDLNQFDVSDVIHQHQSFIEGAIMEAWLSNNGHSELIHQGLNKNGVSDQEIKDVVQSKIIDMADLVPYIIDELYASKQQIFDQLSSPSFTKMVSNNQKVQELVAYTAWSITPGYLKDKALHKIQDVIPPEIVEKTYKLALEHFGERVELDHCVFYPHEGLLDHFDDFDGMKEFLNSHPALFSYCAFRAQSDLESPDHPMMDSLIKCGYTREAIIEKGNAINNAINNQSVVIGDKDTPEIDNRQL